MNHLGGLYSFKARNFEIESLMCYCSFPILNYLTVEVFESSRSDLTKLDLFYLYFALG
jgi:hypothetical protein